MTIKSIIRVLILLLWSLQAKAALISVDYLSTGDGLITQDTATGLKWLDLTYTRNISFNDMETLLDSNPVYDGFRRATSLEVEALFSNAGIVSFGVFSVDNITGAQLLTSLLGDTYEYLGGDRNGGVGFIADMNPDPSHPIQIADYFTDSLVQGFLTGQASPGGGFATPDFGLDLFGHYLVSSVPIPSAVWLFGSGLIGLIGIARRKSA